MTDSATEFLSPAQQARLKQFGVDASVDIHCHCLPGLDDGPATMDDALALCRSLVDDGITHAVATPHQLGHYAHANNRESITESFNALQVRLASEQIPLHIKPGADVRVDDQLPVLLDQRSVMTLADGNAYILLELPHDTVVDPRMLLRELRSRGLVGVLSHPERHGMISRKPELVLAWLQAGAILQVTSGSLVGDFGPVAQAAAWRLIEAGTVSLIASDAHDAARRPPRMTQAVRAIASKLGHAVARRLCVENPSRVFFGEPITAPRVSHRFGGAS